MSAVLQIADNVHMRSARHSSIQTPAITRSFAPFSQYLLQRKTACACGGGCPRCQAKSDGLKVSQFNDPAEIEADQIADRIMRMPADKAEPLRGDKLNHGSGEEETIQQKTFLSHGSVPSHAPAHVQGAIGSGGIPLGCSTRAFFEPRLGYDLSSVRIHAGGIAAESAQSVNAKAYTLGDHIVFGSGEYNSESEVGRHLLAHELVHVVQQHESSRFSVIHRAEITQATREPLYDHDVIAAIDLVWRQSFGHPPFNSRVLDVSDLPEAGGHESEETPHGSNEELVEIGTPSYRDGKYEGVTYREAYFVIGPDGKPGEIHVSKFPADIKDVDVLSDALGFVHTHPSQKRASSSEAAGTLIMDELHTVDEQAAINSNIPVYAVGEKDVLKTNPDLTTQRFSRNKLARDLK